MNAKLKKSDIDTIIHWAPAALEAKDEQIAEATELLHHLYDTFCQPGDCNEITDYFDKWEC